MKQITILVFAVLLLSLKTNSQITRGDWLFGGNISFSSIKSTSDLGTNTTATIQSAGNAGYFFIDRLVAGIKPNIFFSNFKNQSGNNWSNRSSLGPFLRYYFLPVKQRTNLFVESSYAFGTSKVSNQKAFHSNSFSFFTGPVFFLNSSVGLELSVGYVQLKSKDIANSKTNTVQVAIGLQYHLEKE